MEESGLKLEVGKKYLNRWGEVEHIVDLVSTRESAYNEGYRFRSLDGSPFTDDGSYDVDVDGSRYDLVSEYIEPQPITEPIFDEPEIDQKELPLELTQILFEIKQWGEIGDREQESKRWTILSDYARKMSEEATINKYPDNVSSTQHRDLQERRQDPIVNN